MRTRGVDGADNTETAEECDEDAAACRAAARVAAAAAVAVCEEDDEEEDFEMRCLGILMEVWFGLVWKRGERVSRSLTKSRDRAKGWVVRREKGKLSV